MPKWTDQSLPILFVHLGITNGLGQNGNLISTYRRVTYPDAAWALVRASNTGPVLVMRFEAPSAERLAEIRSNIEAVVDQVKRDVGAA